MFFFVYGGEEEDPPVIFIKGLGGWMDGPYSCFDFG